jgi:hypothetical protein
MNTSSVITVAPLRYAGQVVEPCLHLVDDLLAPRRHLITVQQLDVAACLKRPQMHIESPHFSLGADLAAI